MTCEHKESPCPVCAGLDLYKPRIFPCTAGEMKKKLCLDGVDCWCKPDLETENRRMLTALEAISDIATDMLDPVRRAGPTRPKA